MFPFLALVIGAVAGMRIMTGPAVVSLAAYVGWLDLRASWFAFMTTGLSTDLLAGLAVVDLVIDKLPKPWIRSHPLSYALRLISGGFCGAAIGTALQQPVGATVVGVLGAGLGIAASYEARRWLQVRTGTLTAAAFVGDSIAVGGAIIFFCLLL